MGNAIDRSEEKLLGLEQSYRSERKGAFFLAVISGIPLIMNALRAFRIPSEVVARQVETGSFPVYKMALITMFWIFLAYRAHSKLTLIQCIKYHKAVMGQSWGVSLSLVIPAKAGIHYETWIPAFAGMTY
ncbi:MAG: hypothetical protein NTZ78_14850 [Candidatus Aureabacteria bacterium]|nr:hypothetical protein [Candidatus Auribacterota bacterium]